MNENFFRQKFFILNCSGCLARNLIVPAPVIEVLAFDGVGCDEVEFHAAVVLSEIVSQFFGPPHQAAHVIRIDAHHVRYSDNEKADNKIDYFPPLNTKSL